MMLNIIIPATTCYQWQRQRCKHAADYTLTATFLALMLNAIAAANGPMKALTAWMHRFWP